MLAPKPGNLHSPQTSSLTCLLPFKCARKGWSDILRHQTKAKDCRQVIISLLTYTCSRTRLSAASKFAVTTTTRMSPCSLGCRHAADQPLRSLGGVECCICLHPCISQGCILPPYSSLCTLHNVFTTVVPHSKRPLEASFRLCMLYRPVISGQPSTGHVDRFVCITYIQMLYKQILYIYLVLEGDRPNYTRLVPGRHQIMCILLRPGPYPMRDCQLLASGFVQELSSCSSSVVLQSLFATMTVFIAAHCPW